jgi:hypothetical protein
MRHIQEAVGMVRVTVGMKYKIVVVAVNHGETTTGLQNLL